jgi:hypothetical protein
MVLATTRSTGVSVYVAAETNSSTGAPTPLPPKSPAQTPGPQITPQFVCLVKFVVMLFSEITYHGPRITFPQFSPQNPTQAFSKLFL